MDPKVSTIPFTLCRFTADPSVSVTAGLAALLRLSLHQLCQFRLHRLRARLVHLRYQVCRSCRCRCRSCRSCRSARFLCHQILCSHSAQPFCAAKFVAFMSASSFSFASSTNRSACNCSAAARARSISHRCIALSPSLLTVRDDGHVISVAGDRQLGTATEYIAAP